MNQRDRNEYSPWAGIGVIFLILAWLFCEELVNFRHLLMSIAARAAY